MRTIVVTGSAGLIGSETVKRFAKEGRMLLESTTTCAHSSLAQKHRLDDLIARVPGYDHYDLDIRDASVVADLFKRYGGKIDAICTYCITTIA